MPTITYEKKKSYSVPTVKWTVTDERATKYRDTHAARTARRAGPTDFRAIDSEGAMINGEHRLVLIRCGDRYLPSEDGHDIGWEEVFEFLYSCFEPGKHIAYVGFYLGYDFTQWLKSLPRDRAWRLLTPEGKAGRLRKFDNPQMKGRSFYHPVQAGGWEFDILGGKRLKIRPRTPYGVKNRKPWMNICDTGPFFQSSFLAAINPKKWPEPIVTEEEYDLIVKGKNDRAAAQLGPEMIMYNKLECDVLTRLMSSLELGLMDMGIRLDPAQWFGPGQVAQKWLTSQDAISTTDLNTLLKDDINTSTVGGFFLAAKESYFGGWFEIMAHGIIPGKSYSYDINSAYPHIIASLPCLKHGKYYTGYGEPELTADNALCLVHAKIYTKRNDERYYGDENDLGEFNIGVASHRNRHGEIARTFASEGWFWKHELDASIRAGAIREVEYLFWYAYDPCDCPAPLAGIVDLYEERLRINKNSPKGKAYKLTYNSVYGKFAQSVGNPKYGNPIYASLITAGCRTMILDAIATHPGGHKNVVMIATDGVYFLDRHSGLKCCDEPCDECIADSHCNRANCKCGQLGAWEMEIHDNLTLFKPGVYWDDVTRADIAAGKAPQFKTRGVRGKDFAPHIQTIDDVYRSWPKANKDGTCRNMAVRSPWKMHGKGWPHIKVKSSFSMVSMTQAILPGWDWNKAGTVSTDVEMEQSAWNGSKRDGLWYDPERDIYRSKPIGDAWEMWPPPSTPYEKKFGLEDPFSEENANRNGITPDGPVNTLLMDMIRPR